MHRSIKVGNKLCFDKDLKRAWLIHEAKMKNIRSSIDTGRIRPLIPLISSSKKEALKEEKMDYIDKENKFLLQKMDSIYNRSIPLHYIGQSEVAIVKNNSLLTTLNRGVREKQLSKITE
jgi:hypothetical protein